MAAQVEEIDPATAGKGVDGLDLHASPGAAHGEAADGRERQPGAGGDLAGGEAAAPMRLARDQPAEVRREPIQELEQSHTEMIPDSSTSGCGRAVGLNASSSISACISLKIG